MSHSIKSKFKQFLWETYRRAKNLSPQTYPDSGRYVSGDAFRNLTRFTLDRNGLSFVSSAVPKNSLIFVEASDHLVDYFFRKLEPWLKHPYVLISHNGDASMPGPAFEALTRPKLKHWFSTNVSVEHPKVTAIPIGILNARFNPENAHNLNQAVAQKCSKSNTAYVNFHIGDQTEKADYRHKRQTIHDHFAGKDWAVLASRVPPNEYLAQMARHRFVVSPPGHGPDCYRHWEAMYLGSIPVVEKSVSLLPFRDFPMIMVEDWKQVSLEFLEEQYSSIQSRSFETRKLFVDYWLDMIRNLAKVSV